MHYALKLHPESQCPSVSRFEVRLTRQAASIALQFVVHGNIAGLSLPEPASGERVDELWQRTCCEAFVGAADRDAYYEFNFSPSTQWAVYRFTNYRAGMVAANEVETAQVVVDTGSDRLELCAVIDFDRLSALASAPKLRMALSAVIEEVGGRKSYWALAHAAGKPDFHHVAGFTIGLEH
jgi:hypothetical protein